MDLKNLERCVKSVCACARECVLTLQRSGTTLILRGTQSRQINAPLGLSLWGSVARRLRGLSAGHLLHGGVWDAYER